MGRGANAQVIQAALSRQETRSSNAAKIHYPRRPSDQAKMSEAQIAKAEELAAQGVEVYIEEYRSSAITNAFRNYLKSGDAQKINRSLYSFLTMKCGYIAHYDIHGFRSVYANPAELLKGEGKPGIWNTSNPGGIVEHAQYVYTDGKTSLDVYQEMLSLIDNF